MNQNRMVIEKKFVTVKDRHANPAFDFKTYGSSLREDDDFLFFWKIL